MAANEASPHIVPLSLTKLIYTIGAATLLYQCFSWVGYAVLRMPNARGQWAVVGQVYPAFVLLFLAMMIVLIIAYRPMKLLLYPQLPTTQHGNSALRNSAFGLIAGLLA